MWTWTRSVDEAFAPSDPFDLVSGELWEDDAVGGMRQRLTSRRSRGSSTH